MEGAISRVRYSYLFLRGGDGVCVEDFKGGMVMGVELQKMAWKRDAILSGL